MPDERTATDARPTPADRLTRALGWVTALLILVYLGAWWVARDSASVTLLASLETFAVIFPTVMCWLAVYRTRGQRRPQVLLATAAVTAAAMSNVYFVLGAPEDPLASFPVWAYAGYALFYPLLLAAVLTLVVSQLRRLPRAVWLDSALGGLSAAAVLGLVLSPVLNTALDGSITQPSVLGMAAPLLDLLLIAAVTGIVVSPGVDPGRRWPALLGGLLAFACSDMVYAYQALQNSYTFGTPLDICGAIGLGMIASWVAPRARSGDRARSPVRGTVALVVPASATALAMLVLVTATRVQVTTLATVLAGITLLLAAARTHLAFRELVRMGDLRREARTDDLTGLPNRRALYADVPRWLDAAGTRPSALLILDLDRFKEVNDSLGHHVGDRLLIQVGTRLGEELHPGDMLARLGGDEFAILLEDTEGDDAAAVAVRLRAALAQPFTLEGIALQTDVSIGIALFPAHGHDLSLLLRRADMAMYRAKTQRVGHCVYSGDDDTSGDARLRTVEELRTAFVTDQLVVHYQPKMTLSVGKVYGVEALVRWDHPRRGLLYPEAFLGLVEDFGLMHTMTQRVLEIALDQAAVWRAQGHPLTVAVNLSASALMDADLPTEIGALIEARGLPPSDLMLEITEEFLMGDRNRARSVLTRLHDMGIQIAVDDFGTGYSSLSYLRDLPIDELKLDRSFVFPMADDARAAALVASTVALAHSLDLRMVAEGVENDVAYTELASYGCDQAQGFFISRPVPAAVLDLWLSDHRGALSAAEWGRA